MREKSKKTVRTRLLSLLLVFCMTFQMVSYSPGNVVRAEGEEAATNYYMGNIIKDGEFAADASAARAAGTIAAQFSSATLSFETPANGYQEAASAEVAFNLKLKPDMNYTQAMWDKDWSNNTTENTILKDEAAAQLEEAMEAPDSTGKNSAYGDLSKLLNDLHMANPELFPPLAFHYNFGKDFVLLKDSIEVDKEYSVTAKLDGVDVNVGHYTFTGDGKTEDLKMEFVFDSFIYGVWSASAGVNFSLGLNEDLFADNRPVDVKWEDEIQDLTVSKVEDPNNPSSLDKAYSIDKKTINAEDTGKLTDTLFVDYEIDTKILEETDKNGNPAVLAGKTVVDTLPEGLIVNTVKYKPGNNNETALNRGDTEGVNYQFDPDTRRFSYTFPAGVTAKTAVFTIRTALTAAEYEAYMQATNKGKTWQFTNQASLMEPGTDGPIAQSDIINNDMNATFLKKEGQQRPLNGNLFDWKVEVNTYFSELVNSYIVDQIDATQLQYYITEGMTVTKTTDEKTDETKLTLKKVEYDKTYVDLTNASLADAEMQNKLKNLTKDGPVYYEKDNQYIMILPFDNYQNGKVEIKYTTELKEQSNNNNDMKLSNEVKLIWQRYTYGPGIGESDFDFNIDISKEVDSNYDIVQKSGDFQENDGSMDWIFTINQYKKEATKVQIVDNLKDNNLSLKDTVNIENNWSCVDKAGKTVTIHNGGSSYPNYKYDAQNQVVTFNFGDLKSDDYYKLTLHTNAEKQMSVVDKGKTEITNSALVKNEGGPDTDGHKTNAKQTVDNTVVQKDVVTDYDQETYTAQWKITVNPNHLPITGGVLTDVLPAGSQMTSVDAVQKDNGDGNYQALDISGTEASQSGTKIVSWKNLNTATNPEFTFDNQKDDRSSYQFTVTTILNDETTRNQLLKTNDPADLINTAQLSGTVLETPIKQTNQTEPYFAEDDAVTKANNIAIGKAGLFNKGDQTVEWTAVFNGGKTDMSGRAIVEDFSDNPILELITNDKDGKPITNPVQVYTGKWENGEIKEDKDITDTVSSGFNNTINYNGFTFTVPSDANVKNKILVFKFKTYLTDSTTGANVRNTITLTKGSDGSQEVTDSSGADGLQRFDIDDYASIANSPYIKIHKLSASQDKNGNNELVLSDAKFELTEYKESTENSDEWIKASNYNKVRSTKADGSTCFVNLVPDTVLYKLEEKTAPTGYGVDNTDASKQTRYFIFKSGSVTGPVEEMKNVSVKETASDTAATVSAAVINKTFLKTFEFKYTNTPTGSLTFTKTNAGGTGIEDVGFTLVRDDKKVKDQTATSGNDGKVTFDKLDPGTYTLKETSAPAQYLLGSEHKVTVDENGTATIAAGEGLTGDTTDGYKISNQYVSGTIKINKVDSEKDTIKLRGAKFEIYSGVHSDKAELKKDGSDKNYIGEATTDGNGTATFNNVPYSPGGYTIIESAPPKGYEVTTADELIKIQAGAVKFEKNENFMHTVADTVKNTRLRYDVSLTKTNDKETPDKLERSFELTYTGNDSYDTWKDASSGVQIKDSKGSIKRESGKITVTTNDQGELQLTNLPYGDYKLTETTNNKATNIYQNLDLTIKKDQLNGHETTGTTGTTGTTPLVLTANGGTDTVVNKLKKASEFKITKTDDKGDKLKDVTFTLTGKDAYNRDINMSQTTGTDGLATFRDIPIGASDGSTAYTLTETQIGENTTADTDGYTTDFTKTYEVFVKPAANNDVTIQVTNFNVQNNGISITNEPVAGTIEFTKKDEDGRILKGIEFELRRVVNGVAQTTGEGMVFKVTSGDNGAVRFADIPYANYKLVETKGADSSATKEFDIPKSKLTVKNSGTETFNYSESEVTNTLNKASITLTKKDQAGVPLGGVEFAVKRQASSEADNKFESFILNPNGTEYSNYYKNATEVLTATSAADGTLTISGLVYGKYKLVETTEPDNPASDVSAPEITFTVNENGEIQDLHGTTKEGNNNIVTNTIKYGYVNLLKQTDNGENLPGVEFDIYKTDADGNKTGNAILTLTTDENGKLDKTEMEKDGVGLLTYGSYVLEETSVDNAFTMSTESYKFIIDDTTTGEKGTAWISPGSTNNIIYTKAGGTEPTMKPIINTAKRQLIELKKTGASGAALSGAVFAVYDGNALVAELKESTSVSGTYNTLKTTDLNSAITDNTVTENKTIQVGGKDITIPYIKNNKLLAGTYTIKEVKQPDGYVLPDNGKSVDIIVDNGDNAATGNLTNDQTSFSVEKLSNEVVTGDSKVLSGASLKICKDNNGEPSEDTDFSWVSGDTPYAVTGLPAGTYWLLETVAPESYKVADPIQFTLADNGQLYNGAEIKGENKLESNKLTMTDIRVYGQAKLTKTVTGATETLSGVPFKLYKRAGDTPNPEIDKLIAENLTTGADGVIDTTKLSSVTNDETGKVLSTGLWTGHYYFLEQLSDSLYYDTDKNLVEFEIKPENHYTAEKNNPVSVDMSNDKFKTDILFTKYDTTEVKGIAGVSFTLKRSSSHDDNYDETVNADIKTGADGTATLSLDKKGQYKLEETVTPTGYDSATKFVGTFEITDADHGQEVNLNGTNRMMAKQGTLDSTGIANDRLPGSMTITKVDASDNTNKLNGAAFTLYQVVGEVETPVMNGVTGNTYDYDMDNPSPEPVIISNDGKLIITSLPWGQYKLVETTPPDGYIISSTPLEFTIEAGQVDFGAVQSAATTIQNAQSTFALNKADATGGTLVNGAAFQLTDDSDSTVIWETPESDGPASTWSNITGKLVAGKTYTLTETKAPAGYEKAAPVKIKMDNTGVITVTEGGDHASVTNKSTVTVKDQPIEIGLEKIDAESNEKLEGAVFKVTGTFADKAITEIEDTPANLIETLSGQLIAGETYTLTETTAPKGYELAEPINFIVDDAGKIALKDSPTHAALDNNNETIVLKNAQSEIFIQKTDADGKAIGGGAEFSLTGAFADGETVKTIKTEGNQPYSLKGLLSAGQTYTLSEIRAADGYKLETRPVEITMSTAGTISVAADTDSALAEVTNNGLTLNFKDQPITLSLLKTDANNENKPLKGAKFELTGDLADGSKKHTIDLTQKDRLGISALLIASTGTEKHEYTLTETTAPEGYQLQQTPVKFTVDKDGKVTITNIDAVKGFAALSEDKLSLSFANTLKQGDITFTKYGTNDENDLNAKAKLSGAVFGLYTDAETKIPVKDATDKAVTATSGEDGNVTFKDIYVGTYYIKESAAPDDYTADSTIYQAVIDNKGNCDGLHTVAGIEVSNNALSEITNQAVRGKISIAKTDSFDGKAIEGIEFALTKKDKTGKDITVKTGKTDKDGKLVFSNLLMDTEYRIYETQTHSGYVLSTVAQNITLKTDETEKAVAFTNAPTELSFKKVDTTGAGLPDAEFTLYDGGAEVAKAVSDKDGMVTFLYLEKGKTYTLKETKRPGDDYLLSTTEFKAVVDKDGTCTLKNNDESVTEVVNADAGVITLNKTGEDSKPLAGTTFELKNDAGEVIQTQITGADGKLVFADVPMGSYTVVETAAPDPYAVSEDVTKVTLSRGASQKVSVSRVNTLSQVVFHKRGIITEGCAGDLQHAPLEGAVYGLYEDPECATEPAYTATSGNPADGCKVIFTGVTRGTWYVKEITAPQHYMLDTTVYKAVVDSNGHFDGLANLDDTKVADNHVVDAAVTTDIVLKKVNEQKPDEVLPGSTYGLFKKAAKASPAQARSFSFFGTESAAETEDESEWQQIAEATTDQDGYLRFEGVLMGVEYSIRELKAPEGSHVSEKPVNIKFGVNEAGKPVIESIDLGLADPSDPNSPPTATVDPETGEIVWLEPSIVTEISKTDMNANLLAGARLRITVKDGSGAYVPLTQTDGQPAEWVSGEQPETFVKLMKIGEDYRLEEIEAPSGYKLAAPVDFTVRTPEQGVGPGENLTEQVVLKNELTALSISKTTINSTDELPGAVLTVYKAAEDGSIARDEAGNEIVAQTITGESLRWTSGTEMKKIEGLSAGTYVLREITAPDGYEVAEEITFTLMPDGTVMTGGKACEGNIVRMQDKPVAETGTPGVQDKPQTAAPNNPDVNSGAATGIAGSVSPAAFWGVLALLSVAALLVCSIVVWRRKRW
ncbi:MSCRAMM family protein [Eubacterium limosum]|uniref:MSCRAMM family protein n=1 Tax=Eubacterium limosum TaxID=1736 RepID=UPI001063C15B|nr:SpaA isopeptide-forming pilin-related protein [Eubacterium limosum]